jgi:two-component system sensor histidine kinase DesK
MRGVTTVARAPTLGEGAHNGGVTAIQDRVGIRHAVDASSGGLGERHYARLATAAAVGLSVLLPAIELARTALAPEAYGNPLVALTATACALPLHLRHVVFGLRGERPPAAALTLATLAVVNVAAAIVVGVGWLLNVALLAVSILIVIPWPWALALVAAVVTGAAAFAGDDPLVPWPYVALTLVWRTVTLYVPVRLVAEVRQLEGARRELRDRAVVRERLRIEAELRRGLGGALEGILGSATRAGAAVSVDAGAAVRELQELVGRSRQGLADARRLIVQFRETSVGAELDAAVTLLAAAGVRSHVVVQDGLSLDEVDEQSRSVVRSAVAQALREDGLSECRIEMSRDDLGQLRMVVSSAVGATAERPRTVRE